MNREFQAVYRAPIMVGTIAQLDACGQPVFGLPQVLDGVVAVAADQVEAMLKAAGFAVLSVQPTRAVVDWTKPNFDREEAAEFFCITSKTLSMNKGAGDIPFAQLGNGIYPRVLLEKFVQSRLNPAGKAMLKELEQAA